jgi:hypothetical protein
LVGEREIGTYPITSDGSCYWGCIDIDIDDISKAMDVQDVWKFFGIPSWIETSRSKGYHVWVFPSHPVSAATMRKAGLYVSQIARMPDVEVNPKQLEIWSTPRPGQAPQWFTYGIGNTVRLPYSGRAEPGRMCMVHRGEPQTLPDALRLVGTGLASPTRLRAVAGHYRAAQRLSELQVDQDQGSPYQPRSGPFKGRQEAWDILDGIREIERGERDNQFYTVARLMKSKEIPLDIARRTMVRIWNDQTPDKTGYRMDNALMKVERAYDV